jgi:hypothetical protein
MRRQQSEAIGSTAISIVPFIAQSDPPGGGRPGYARRTGFSG